MPLGSHAEFEPAVGRPDPVALLQGQDDVRIASLVPIRFGRMAASPFSFYRGAAIVMADDLARTPTTGWLAQACGDAHLDNFGAFGTDQGTLVFDVNDFDETYPAPWEWDVKRLVASAVLAAREIGAGRPAQRCRPGRRGRVPTGDAVPRRHGCDGPLEVRRPGARADAAVGRLEATHRQARRRGAHADKRWGVPEAHDPRRRQAGAEGEVRRSSCESPTQQELAEVRPGFEAYKTGLRPSSGCCSTATS